MDVYPDELKSAIEHARGTEDAAYAPSAPPRMHGVTADHQMFAQRFLPEGHHWCLHIEHSPLEDAGGFTSGGNKLCWHSTESPWERVDLMWQVLRDKRAAAHFVIGGRHGLEHPVVKQMIPLDRAARALEHPGGPETNRARAIQIEVCGFAAQAKDWPETTYKALANLFVLISHRVAIDNVARQDFSHPHRMGGQEWVDAKGHVDHAMCPLNTHTDVGNLREEHLMQLIRDCPDGGHQL